MAPAQGNLVNRERILFGLALSGIAIVLIAIVYRIDSHQSLGTVEPQREEAMQAQKASSTDAEVNESEGVVVPQPSLGDEQNIATTEPLSDTGYVPPPGFVDEETSNKMVREEATRDVPKLYSLLLESLDLTPSEKDALLALLIEDRIASTTTPYSRGMEIDEQDRAKRIAGIMGDPKLQQFLALERNLGSYAEIQYVETVLQQHANPITESQRDRMLEILIDVQNQELTLPGADADRGSIEALEYRLAQIDERERLFIEQAASVLSAEQVRYLFDRYQRMSYRRADALEAQRKARANDSTEDLPLWYPARTN
jgi:hypothetical protein